MLRKQVLQYKLAPVRRDGDDLDIASIASVVVTSEETAHPIDNAFDKAYGRGGSQWIAGTDGEQVIILSLDVPLFIRSLGVEIEETDVARKQKLEIYISRDREEAYTKVLTQEYEFSPPGTTFESELWELNAEAVTNIQVRIIPDMSGRPCRAKLTRLSLR
jgi:hypothetical protein